MDGERAERYLQQARVAFARGDATRSRIYLGKGLAEAGGSNEPVEVALLILAAQLTAWEFDPIKTQAATRAAVRAARRIRAFVADAHLVRGQALYVQGSPACVRHYRAAAAAASETGDLNLEFEARAAEASALQALGDSAAAIKSARKLERDATAAGKTFWARDSERRRIRIAWLSSGQPAPAILGLKRLARQRNVGLHRPQMLGDVALALADAGEIEDARRAIRNAAQAADTRWAEGISAFYRAEIEWAAGNPQRALDAADEALTSDLPGLLATVTRGTRLWALFELGSPEADAELDTLQVPPMLEGVRIENDAFRRLVTGSPNTAAVQLDAAATAWAGNVARCELRARWGRGEVLRRAGEKRLAMELLRTVELRAASAGLVPILGRSRASLGRLESSPRRQAHQRLSRREQQILALVGDDLPTQTIASMLEISPRTVDSHIANAMAKLGATTRRQAAAMRSWREATSRVLDVSSEEQELLTLLASGCSVSEAASRLGISRRTASRLLRRIRSRNGVTTGGALRHFGANRPTGQGEGTLQPDSDVPLPGQ